MCIRDRFPVVLPREIEIIQFIIAYPSESDYIVRSLQLPQHEPGLETDGERPGSIIAVSMWNGLEVVVVRDLDLHVQLLHELPFDRLDGRFTLSLIHISEPTRRTPISY